MILLRTIDITGRKIDLTVERWRHIIGKHSEMIKDLEFIEGTITQPLVITISEKDDSVRFYYRYIKSKAAYLLVAIKYLNGKGFVITSYYTNKILGVK